MVDSTAIQFNESFLYNDNVSLKNSVSNIIKQEGDILKDFQYIIGNYNLSSRGDAGYIGLVENNRGGYSFVLCVRKFGKYRNVKVPIKKDLTDISSMFSKGVNILNNILA